MKQSAVNCCRKGRNSRNTWKNWPSSATSSGTWRTDSRRRPRLSSTRWLSDWRQVREASLPFCIMRWLIFRGILKLSTPLGISFSSWPISTQLLPTQQNLLPRRLSLSCSGRGFCRKRLKTWSPNPLKPAWMSTPTICLGNWLSASWFWRRTRAGWTS